MLEALKRFADTANTSKDVRRAVGAWHVNIIVNVEDDHERWVMEVRDGCIVSVHRASENEAEPAGAVVNLSGESTLLQDLFDGRVNPLRAANQGLLEVHGEMYDQTRLDAVALLLWGP